MSYVKKTLTAVMALAMLAGCSSSGTATTSSGSSKSDATVKVAIDADLMSMDYHIATDGNSFIMESMCESVLTELDDKGKELPELAKSWDVSSDGLTYTFHLADAKWSNGDAVTANDFVYAWQRLDDPALASEYAFILDTIHVKNAADINAGKMDKSQLGVKAVDDKTFEVDLTLPCAFLLPLMAFPSFFPLNQKFYEEQGSQYALSEKNLLYCGPYTMTEFNTGSQYTFTKNKDYFKASDTSDEAQTVVFKYLQDTQSAMLDYQSGNLDVVKLQGEQVDQYKDKDGFQNRLTGYLWFLSIDFDTTKYASNADFQNLNLRKAMSYALDRDTICNNVLKDGSVAADGIIPQELATGPDGKDYRTSQGQLVSYDAAKAKEYYAKAKEELGHDASFELLFEDSEASKAVAEYIQSNLESLGMTITLVSKPKKTRIALMQVQDYQVALHRWGPDYADPETYMDLFLKDNVSNNYGKYNNAKYDALVEAADSGADATDATKRWKDFQDAEKILVDEDPGVVPVYQNGGAMMVNKNVTGIEFHSVGVDSYRHMKKS